MNNYMQLPAKRMKFALMALIVSLLSIHLLSGMSRADMSGNLSDSINNRENLLVQPSETIFSVQVGVYSVRDTAIITIAELRRVGINCSVNKWEKPYKVSCGSLDSKEDANELRMQLAGLGHKDAFVLTVKRDKLITDSSIANKKNVVTKSLSEAPQELSVNGNTGTINSEQVQKEKKSNIGIASETDSNEAPLLQILQKKDLKGTEDSVSDINTEKTGEQDSIALMERIQAQDKNALKVAVGEKKNPLLLITAVVLVITLMFFLFIIFIRRVGSIQGIRANKIMESLKDLFNSIERDKISVEKDNASITKHLYLKLGNTTKNKFLRYAVPVIGGMIIGILSSLIMKFMGKLSF